NEDKRVFIEFEEPIKRILLVPSQYQTLEEAFINASPGDEIVLEQGTHYLGTFGDYAVALHDWYFEGEDINPGFNREIYEGLDFSGRALTVRSVDPDDPDVIANTIIDCRGNRYTPRRAFLFNHGEGADSVVTGLTIINGYMVGALGGNGTVNNGPDPFPPNPPITEDGVPNQANSGEDADGDGFGGAILCDNASSPKILNCVITDCTVTGGQGGDGNHGFSVMVGNAQTAGIAGNGTGNGFGGAVACVGASSPTITNCTIKNNRARGACGGIGGNGGSTGNGKAGWGGDSGTGMGDGYGGAVHSDALSLPIFQQVVFANNIASAGFAYSGGAAGIGTANYAAPYNFDAPGGDGMAIGSFDIAGGAVYGGQGSILDYTDCQFIENLAYNSMSDTNPSFETAPRTMFPELIAYTMGGAVFAESTSNVDFDNCDFIDNISGAMRVESDSTVNILDCLFQENATRDLSEFQYSALPDAWPWDPPARNSTVQGGALYIAQDCPQVLVDNTSFMGNETQSNGGAVSLKSNATFTNCQFGGNVAQGTGGAIDMSYSTERTVGDVTTRVYSTLELLTDNCTFTANEADLGGAINAHHLTLTSTGSYFAGNTAWSGGALTLVDSDATITGGTMSNNHATGIIHDHYDVLLEGIGGAAAFVNSSADIQNCILQNNKADAERSYGGAIAFNGTNDRILHSIKNSLFTGNNATLTGGAVMCSANAKPFIESCTFADNTVNEAGGAVYCDWTANPQISNSIFAGNVKYAVYEEQIGGDSSIVGSLFFDNADGDYFDANTGQAYNGAAGINSVAGNSANVDGDPVFVAGPLGMYYLNQGASAAVNTGVGDASFYGLNIFTTDPVGALDAGVVDIGYHYNDPTTLPQYNLTVSVPGGNGTVEVDTGLYYAGATVTITAIPNSGYRVKTWSGGTVNDSSTALVNAVIMTGDKDIVITFNQPRTIVVGSNNDYTSIQHGIDEAEEGDIVVVAPGHYSSASAAFPLYALQLGGKNITITGSNPDDSGSVAATVLEGVNLELIGLGPDTIIEGLTFTGGDAWTNSGVVLIDSDVTIRNCVFADNRISGGNAITGPGCSVDGGDGGSVTGMLNIIDSSPNISSCIFRDNIILGGDGSDGNTGCTGAPGGDGGWAGRAYGGAVFCSLGSEPVFLDCDFINNSAIGGNAGNGGANGAPNPYGGRGGNYEWSPTQEEYPNWDWWNGWTFGDKYSRSPFPLQANRFDWSLWAKWTGWDRFNNWAEYEEYYGEFVMGGGNAYDRYDDWTRYSGYGGAVYCEFASSAKFIGCSFRGNHTDGGLCGIGGSGPAPPRPVQRYDIPNAGGAVYATKDSDLEFVNCNFTENFADTTLISDDPEAPEFGVPDDIYISFGGAVAYEDGCEVRFQGCEVADNDATLGGGVYSAFSGLEVVDCNSVDNTAYHGAGIYALDTEGVINESQFLRNAAANIAPLTTMYGQGGAFHSVTSKVNVLNSIFRENRASASGGAVYYNGSDNDNAFQNELFNSLFTKNTAGRDGGAVSVNRNTDIVIGNCTISDNSVTGGLGEAGGLGGGLYVSYDSFAKVIDSIIWDNLGVLGSQLAVGSGDEYGARPSTVEMTYTDIGPIVDPNQHIFVDFETDPAPAPLVVPTLVSGEKIYAEYDAGNEKAKIIVTLVEPAGLRDSVDWTSEASKAQFRTEISYIQAPVLSSMSSAEFDLRYRFENLAGFSGSITKVALEKLLTNPAVKHIEPVIYVQPALAQSIPLANATEARMKYDGTGLSVAIVDTGVDYTHRDIQANMWVNNGEIAGNGLDDD
ncbi:MAG: hypothetical protein KAS23_04225, partial [Anaerohalosphaera sp.]|nr:hypothetical protein [Anaerohalosphaera sp.]